MDVVPFIDDVNISIKMRKHVVWGKLVELFELAGISKGQQKMLTLYYRDRLTMLVIAKAQGITREAVRMRIRRAIGLLHMYIIDKDIEMDDFVEIFAIEENRACRSFNGYVQKDPVYP